MSSAVPDTRQVKVAYCQACGGWVLASTFPACEGRKDSIKEFATCARAGNNINVLLLTDYNNANVPMCGCWLKKKKKVQPQLFDAADTETP